VSPSASPRTPAVPSQDFRVLTIMHTDYRRPLETFPETISAVVALHFYAIA